jgi:hypothetical protein
MIATTTIPTIVRIHLVRDIRMLSRLRMRDFDRERGDGFAARATRWL